MQMNETAAFRRASDGFLRREGQITADQWSASTPCTEWDVRALVNHIAGEYLWVKEMLDGRTVAEVGDRLDGDLLGDDPLQALTNAQQGALAALDEPDALGKTVHLSFGDVPAAEYARQMTVDSVIHSWDLARATRGDETLDPELVDLCFAELQATANDWRSAGVFGPETAPSDGSTQAKLLALSGR
jgi:uncharacterized protein (TIGR03086 family)